MSVPKALLPPPLVPQEAATALSWCHIVLHISIVLIVAVLQLLMFPCIFVVVCTLLWVVHGVAQTCSIFMPCASGCAQPRQELALSRCTLSGRVPKRVQLSTVNVLCVYQILYLGLFLGMHRDSGIVCSDMVGRNAECPGTLDKLFRASVDRNLWYPAVLLTLPGPSFLTLAKS